MSVRILVGDCRTTLATLPDQSVQCCVTSPPYFGLRDYGHAGQIGLEQTPDAYVAELVAVFREVRRVLQDDGTLWLNLGDSYSSGASGGLGGSTLGGGQENQARSNRTGASLDYGMPPKNLIGIPWRVAFALQVDGWYLRSDIIWHKPNPMPENVSDRPTKSHEYIFLLSKSCRYFYDAAAVEEEAEQIGRVRADRIGGNKYVEGVKHSDGSVFTGSETRNKRTVWTVPTSPFKGAHFATFPPALIEPCILAGCPKDGTVLDPFGGAGTTGLVADRIGRNAILCELNPEYAALAEARIRDESPLFANVEAT